MMRQIEKTASTLLLLMCCIGSVRADDWNLWRGPHCNGAVSATNYFGVSPFDLDVIWKRAIGSAYSSVAISNGRVLTMFNDGSYDYLGAFAIDTGQEIWRLELGRIYKGHDGGHDGPVSTPVADADQVYILGPRGKLMAVRSSSGKLVWSVGLTKKFAAFTPFWGFASTPVLYRDLVIVQVDGDAGHGIVALDRDSGTKRWHQALGRTEYRSPILVQEDGFDEIVASSANVTIGLNPLNGHQRWRYGRGISNDKSPLYLGNGQILLLHGGCELIQVDRPQKVATRVWRSSQFRGNYDLPVFKEGYLYGFTDRFLTCIDAANGRRVWRSRAPGGKGTILIDGHLIVLGDHGDVVVVQAEPTGYFEKSRVNVSDGAAYSWPAFADETIVVRNLKHLVGLKSVSSNSVLPMNRASQPDSWEASRFAAFVNAVSTVADKGERIDEFMQRHEGAFPLVEDDQWVHFVYRGPAQDVGIAGTMLAQGEQDAMQRIAGTNLFYRSYAIEPGANWDYQMVVNFDKTIVDPLNWRRSSTDPQTSVVVTAAWKESRFSRPYEGRQRGRLETFQFSATDPRFTSTVSVYLPANYRPQDEHRLIVVLDGQEWLERGDMRNVLDHVSAASDGATIVAFLPSVRAAELGGWRTEAYAEALSKELLPQLQQRYRLVTGPYARTLLGRRGAAVAAVYTALRFDQLWSHCIALSYGRADTVRADMIEEAAQALAAKGKGQQRPSFHVAWNRYEVWRPQSFDCREQSQQLSKMLKRRGFKWSGGQDPTGATWSSWQEQAVQALSRLFPVGDP